MPAQVKKCPITEGAVRVEASAGFQPLDTKPGVAVRPHIGRESTTATDAWSLAAPGGVMWGEMTLA